jgi:hypothetical protein
MLHAAHHHRHRLEVTSGALRGASFRVEHGLTIGRAPNVDVLVLARGVAPRHAEIRVDDDGEAEVVDLGSGSGVWIDGQRVASRRLTPGCAFEIAGIRFELVPERAPGDDVATEPHDVHGDARSFETLGATSRIGAVPHDAYRGALMDDIVTLRELWLRWAEGERLTAREAGQVGELLQRLSLGHDGRRPRMLSFATRLPAMVRLGASPDAACFEATAIEVGVNGARLRCDPLLLAPGDEVWLAVTRRDLRDAGALLPAVVAATRDDGLDLVFVGRAALDRRSASGTLLRSAPKPKPEASSTPEPSPSPEPAAPLSP